MSNQKTILRGNLNSPNEVSSKHDLLRADAMSESHGGMSLSSRLRSRLWRRLLQDLLLFKIINLTTEENKFWGNLTRRKKALAWVFFRKWRDYCEVFPVSTHQALPVPAMKHLINSKNTQINTKGIQERYLFLSPGLSGISI